MRLALAITFLSFILSAASSRSKPPRVDHVSGSFLNEFGGYVNGRGENSEVSTTSKRQGTPYWYETITHQGISAFGPNGYQVYRNVKDFGATGKHQP
jgi:glucan 1,3-beta-glucosidase